MKVFILSIFIVGIFGMEWKAINDFNSTFKEFSVAAEKTIKNIENILRSSSLETSVFFDSIFDDELIVSKMTQLRFSGDECIERFIEKDDLRLSFQIQAFQLEMPLRRRINDLRAKLSDVNSTMGMLQDLADSKYWVCTLFNGSCVQLTEKWLGSKIRPLACTVYANCTGHSIAKRSSNVCPLEQFTCPKSGDCIPKRYFCDGDCDCSSCDDEPRGCIKDCKEFRCKETFRCISESMKCNGKDDCGDGSDEEGCHRVKVFPRSNCSTMTGGFLCDTTRCLDLERVCDGGTDCADGSDEGPGCLDGRCPPGCVARGGVCWAGPGGTECLLECPPGTFETSYGCSTRPEASPTTLAQLMDETPLLTARHAARIKYLKTKTMLEIYKSLVEVVKCKKGLYSWLSNVVQFSSELEDRDENSTLPPTSGNAATSEILSYISLVTRSTPSTSIGLNE